VNFTGPRQARKRVARALSQERIMRLFILAAAATATLSTPALAADRLTDSQFLKASRCLGLAQSKALGEVDTTGLEALIKAESRNRPPALTDRAADSRTNALREGRRTQSDRRDGLVAEWEGPCKRIASL
jgi:hypothetical protein